MLDGHQESDGFGMTRFNILHDNDSRPDRVFVQIENLYDVAVIRTPEGLRLEVYPLTDGCVWDDPIDRFEVLDCDVEDLSKEMEVV